MDETMHAIREKSSSNCEASASPSDPVEEPFLDFFYGQLVA